MPMARTYDDTYRRAPAYSLANGCAVSDETSTGLPVCSELSIVLLPR